MGRKKKEEIHHILFNTTHIPLSPEINLSPYTTIETTSLGDSTRQFITTTGPGTSLTYTGSIGDAKTVYYPSKYWESYSTTLGYEDFMRQIRKEEEEKVKVDKIVSSHEEEHIMACQNKDDLIPENILVTMSAVKGKLMFEIAPIHIKEIICCMTPQVKTNLITAGKRLRMYGKKAPIIPSFDEYGNRLPDQIEIGNSNGIIVNIVDPKDYGEWYFELKAVELPNVDYKLYDTDTWIKDDEFPF